MVGRLVGPLVKFLEMGQALNFSTLISRIFLDNQNMCREFKLITLAKVIWKTNRSSQIGYWILNLAVQVKTNASIKQETTGFK